MFKEFNVEFQDAEMIGGADNLLENTKVTKVVMSGDNKMSSLDSAFKNCSELDNIQGGLDLNGVSNIDNILGGNSLIKSIYLKNINNENISANNSFPNVEEINISGELYNKKAIQNVIASKEWTFDNITYSGTVGDNIVAKEANATDDNQITIKDTLEQKAKGLEIVGKTYENLADGKGEYELTDAYSVTWTKSNNVFENMPSMIEIPEIWGNTVQGHTNVVTEKMIYDSITNSSATTTVTMKSDGSINVANWVDLNSWMPTEEDMEKYSIKLKPNTTYSTCAWRKENGARSGVLSRVESDGFKSNHNGSYKFTTDNTGRVFLCPYGYVYDFVVRVYEGDIPNIENLYNYDLSYIQSVGDLYVDENGEAILDEEGNEQYKLEIDCSNDLICDFTKYEYSPKRLWNGKLENHIVKSANVLKNEVQFQMDGNAQGVSILGVKANVLGVYTIRFKYNSSDYRPFIRMNSMKKGAFVEQPTTTIKTDEEGYCYAEFSLSKEFDELRFTLGINTCKDASFTHSFSDVVIYLGTGLKIVPQSNKTTILMPCKLMKVSDGRDRLFWDVSKNKFIVEKNVRKLVLDGTNTFIRERGQNGYVLYTIDTYQSSKPNGSKFINDTFPYGTDFGDTTSEWMMAMWNSKLYLSISEAKGDVNTWFKNNPTVIYYHSTIPETIETKILEKPSLETYQPKTYISTNTEIQPNQMTINNKKILINLKELSNNTGYTIQFKCNEKSDNPIKFNLCGTEKEVNMPIGVNHVSITTSNNLTNNQLELSGAGNIVSEVMVVEGEMNQYPTYFDGVQSVGELQDDGSYKIDIKTNNGGFKNLFDINNFIVNSNNRGDLTISDNTITSNFRDWFSIVETNVELQSGKEYLISFDCEFLNINTANAPLIMLGNKGQDINVGSISDFEVVIRHKPNSNENLKKSFSIVYTPTSNKTIYLGLSLGVRVSGTLKLSNMQIVEYSENLDTNIPLKESNISVMFEQPLTKEDKLYWNKSNGRYEIDRNGSIEIPTVEGDVIDLPRLYQREDTNLVIETGDIKPSQIKVEYLDID